MTTPAEDIISDYDNDQLDYLWNVAAGWVMWTEEWALKLGLINPSTLLTPVTLTLAGEEFIASRDWIVVPRKIIYSYEVGDGAREEVVLVP